MLGEKIDKIVESPDLIEKLKSLKNNFDTCNLVQSNAQTEYNAMLNMRNRYSKTSGELVES
jgi:hypothetical protein